MAGFLYFIPNRDGKPVENPAETGIKLAADLATPGVPVAVGPDGGPGVVFAMLCGSMTATPRPTFNAEKQTWRRAAAGAHWLGWITARPPTPQDLARSGRQVGHVVQLADGDEWIVPIVRLPTKTYADARPGWPHTLGLADGRVIVQVRDEFAADWERTQATWLEYVGRGAELDPAVRADIVDQLQVFQFCVKVLSLNYKMGCDEAGALGILSVPLLAAVIDAALDGPGLRAVMAEMVA